jgi:hypothetical protein
MRTGVVAAAAVLLSLAGCGSSASSSSVAPRTASDALTAAHPAVSVGPPSPSDKASRTQLNTVTKSAVDLLSHIAAPLQAIGHGGKPVGVLTDPPGVPASDNLIDVADSWTAPGTVEADLAYIQRHLPADLTPDGSAGGTGDVSVVFYRAAPGAADQGATVYISVSADPAGGVDVRVDVQDVWRPVRPAVDVLPANVTGATLVRRTGVTTSPPSPTTATVRVDADVARHLSDLLNGLPTQAAGIDAGGGADTTVTITFSGDPNHLVFVGEGGFYDRVDVTSAGGRSLRLADAGDLIDYIDTLFAASSSEPQPPTTGR